MKSYDSLEYDWNSKNRKLVNAPAFWNVIYELSKNPENASELVGLEYFCLTLLDIFYTNRTKQRLSDVKRRELTSELLGSGILKQKYNNISQIPKQIFTENNWNDILEDYQSSTTANIIKILGDSR